MQSSPCLSCFEDQGVTSIRDHVEIRERSFGNLHRKYVKFKILPGLPGNRQYWVHAVSENV